MDVKKPWAGRVGKRRARSGELKTKTAALEGRRMA